MIDSLLRQGEALYRTDESASLSRANKYEYNLSKRLIEVRRELKVCLKEAGQNRIAHVFKVKVGGFHDKNDL